MKWIGILVIMFGFLAYVSITAFEKSMPLVQFVDKDQVMFEPMHIMLPPGVEFVKGTGKDGAKFVDIHSEAAKYIPIARYLGLAKLGGLAICLLGAVGFGFERWREKAKKDYELEHGGMATPPPKSPAKKTFFDFSGASRVDDFQRPISLYRWTTNEISALLWRNKIVTPMTPHENLKRMRKPGETVYRVACMIGEPGPDYEPSRYGASELLTLGTLGVFSNSLVFTNDEGTSEATYEEISDVRLARYKGIGSMVRIEFPDRVVYVTFTRSNFRGWYCGIIYPEVERLFKEIRERMRFDRKLRESFPTIDISKIE